MQESIAIHDLYSKAGLFIRSSIITLIAGTFAIVKKCNPFADTQMTDEQIKKVYALAPILIGVLWIFEMGYFKKFNQNILIARANHRQIQQQSGTRSFFLEYKPFTHRWFYITYPAAIAYLWWYSKWECVPTLITGLLVGLAVFEMGCIAKMWVDEPRISPPWRKTKLLWCILKLIICSTLPQQQSETTP